MQLSVRDVSRLFDVSEQTVYRWIDSEQLPANRVSGVYSFNRQELLEWATRHQRAIPDELLGGSDVAERLPMLSEALEVGKIFHGLKGNDKSEVLRSVVALMSVPDSVNREFLLSVLLAREKMESTGIGDGIAIPHVRNPIVLQVTQPTVTLCFLENPVEFGALDGKPVFALFSLVSPTVRSHLHLLSQLSFALRDDKFKAVITRQGSKEEIFTELRRVESRIAKPAAANG